METCACVCVHGARNAALDARVNRTENVRVKTYVLYHLYKLIC